jgi:hypothetical protein
MIEHWDAHDFPRFMEAAGDCYIFCGWFCIPAWMIVTHDDCHCPGANRIAKDLTWVNKRGCMISNRNKVNATDVVAVI